MNRVFYAGAAVAALIAIPAIAQVGDRGARASEPMTRAAVQAHVEARFARVDADRDGFVTRAEADARIAAARGERQAQSGERRGRMFDRLDADKNGSISRAEFDAHAAARAEHRGGPGAEGRGGRPMMRHARMMRRHHGAMAGGMGGFGAAMFDRLDADHDGRVSLAEASSRALAMFDRADADRNGTVTPEERQAAREAFRASRQGRRGG